ncbi:Hypothetical protein Tpal_436 [Trichococcus palustris]|jgi:hypothetical protein|uniref:DUF937 domain-containing protein n=1 Tax=Trichococcus palustris TaxID=140314 RepID=A0A143YA23_9LACT|nr:DUF937 domain-containing protein [Trichococcus palustris]CZQ83363.1 Hypothetical protein Tpal_436 [Trichococcus palustris]SFK69665.1 protein of unknown function [Trichococcus palustris]
MVQINNISDMMGEVNKESSIQALGSKTGVNPDPSVISKMAILAISLILRALSKNVESKAGKDSLSDALEQHKGKTKDVTSIEDVISKADTADGEKILDHAFGDKDKVVDQIAAQTGLGKSDVAKVLASMAPMILGMLADKKDADGLDADGVANQTDIFTKEAEKNASNNFDITDLFPKQGGTTQTPTSGGVGGILGSILGNLF